MVVCSGNMYRGVSPLGVRSMLTRTNPVQITKRPSPLMSMIQKRAVHTEGSTVAPKSKYQQSIIFACNHRYHRTYVVGVVGRVAAFGKKNPFVFQLGIATGKTCLADVLVQVNNKKGIWLFVRKFLRYI